MKNVRYIAIEDLLNLYNGNMTYIHYVLSGRIIDVKEYKERGGFYWNSRISKNDVINKGDKSDPLLDSYFEKLIGDLNTNGMNPYIGAIRCSKTPFVACGGTHRLAFCFVNGIRRVPVWFTGSGTVKSLDFSKDVHSEWKFLDKEEISILETEYKNNLKMMDLSLMGFCCNEESILSFLSEYGDVEILEVREIQNLKKGNCSVWNVYIENKNMTEKVVFFKIKLYRQSLYVQGEKIKSHTVDEILEKVKREFKSSIYISPTVTENAIIDNFRMGIPIATNELKQIQKYFL